MLTGGDAPIDYPAFVKPIDETRTNDNTLTPDTHLQFVTEPNTIYFIRGGLLAYTHGTPDMKWTMQHTGTTSNFLMSARRMGTMDAPTTFMTAGDNDFWMIDTTQLGAATPIEIVHGSSIGFRAANYFEGILSVGGSGGVFSIIWAQFTSDANATTMKAGSWLHRQIVTAAQANLKTSDTQRFTTTASADPTLQEALSTGIDYHIRLGAWLSSETAVDMQMGVDDGGGTPVYFGGFTNLAETFLNPTLIPDANEQTAKDLISLTTPTLQPMNGGGAATTRSFWDLEAAAKFSVAATPFAFNWAQNTASGVLAATVHADSYMLVRSFSAAGDLFVVKPTDEARTSDTVITDDDDLFVTLEADSAYIVSIMIVFTTASATPDIQYELSFSGTCLDFTGDMDWSDPGDRAQAQNDAAQVFGFTGDGATNPVFNPKLIGGNTNGPGGIRYGGLFRTGSSGGVLRYRWAQNTTSVSATTIKAGSFILAEKKA